MTRLEELIIGPNRVKHLERLSSFLFRFRTQGPSIGRRLDAQCSRYHPAASQRELSSFMTSRTSTCSSCASGRQCQAKVPKGRRHTRRARAGDL
ncbi:hypothetical protein EVAR_97821_1 [Eumeta japonica]|uniref:Uncharacterized protein n=1 Tax=Eumeta variegata TaxID=151549 RepID=A0A4C1X9X4_EUMVA|nr:hypothetical protein EVAR_97821_1 [Eumeta japonica]